MANDSPQFIKNIQEVLSYLENDFKNYKPLLDLVATEVVKNIKHTDAYVAFINNQLSTAETRKTGLIVLHSFLPFCTNEILEEEGTAWLNNSLKNCKTQTLLSDEALKVIKPLLQICSASPDLNRTVTSGTLNKIIENITKIDYNNENSINALKCLDTCLRFYSGSCIPYRESIKNYILSFVDCSFSPTVVRLAGKCYLSLQQIGGGGTKGINYKEAWKTSHLSICNSIHSLMDELFESLMELRHSDVQNSVPLLLPNLPVGDKQKLTLNRIINLITFLQEMLLGAFPVAKSVDPGIILELITRGLSITKATLSGQTFNDAMNLFSNLNVIHKHLLKLLQSLIVCLGCDLIPYATLICKLIINNLKSTKLKDINIKRFCDLRIVAYQTLSLWITTAKAASCINTFSESIIPLIVIDITPQISELNLTVQNGSSKHLSKKAKRKIQQEQITQSGIAKNYSPINRKSTSSTNNYQTKICSEALDILRIILVNCGCLLKPTIHKQLQVFVVKTLSNIQTGDISCPYDHIECRIGLYKVLSTLITNKHWNMSSPVEYAINILAKSQMDENPDIVSICSTAMSVINNTIHPQFATLQFPLDIENLRKELNIVPEKNIPFPVFVNDESEKETEVMEINIEENTEENLKIEHDNPVNEKLLDNLIIENVNNKPETNTEESKNTEINETVSISTDQNTQDTENEKLDENNTEQDQIIITDDEVMESLVLEDDKESEEINIISDINTDASVEKTHEISEEKNEDIMDLDESEMLNSFVDVVN